MNIYFQSIATPTINTNGDTNKIGKLIIPYSNKLRSAVIIFTNLPSETSFSALKDILFSFLYRRLV